MEAKDFIYLGLLGVIALVSYRRGFCQGVRRTRRIWKSLLERTVPPLQKLPPPETQPTWSASENRVVLRGSAAYLSKSTMRGSFGRN